MDIVRTYKDIVSRFNELGTQWLQIDEPILVTDLTEEDIALFREIYDALLSEKGRASTSCCKRILETSVIYMRLL